MHHQVGAKLERTGEDRRGDGRVDREQGAGVMRERRDGRNVADGPERIARRLDIDQLGGPRLDGCAQGGGIGRVDEVDLVPERTASVRSQCRNAQYITSDAKMWEGSERLSTIAVAAAMPDANSAASCAFSITASTASAWRVVALSGRPYA